MEQANIICGTLSRELLVTEISYTDSAEESPSGVISCSFSGTLAADNGATWDEDLYS